MTLHTWYFLISAILLIGADLLKLSTLIAIFTLDRLGRRKSLYWGAVVMGISMFLSGGFSRAAINYPHEKAQYGAAAASFTFIFSAGFGATWLTIPWLYPAEIFPLQVRAKGNAWGVVGWCIGNGWTVSPPINDILSKRHADEIGRFFSCPPCSKRSPRRPSTFSAPSTFSPFLSFGPSTLSRISALWKRWIFSLLPIHGGIGMLSRLSPCSGKRTQSSSRPPSVDKASSILKPA